MRDAIGTIMIILLVVFAACWIWQYLMSQYGRNSETTHNWRLMGKIDAVLEIAETAIMSTLVILAVWAWIIR